MSKSIARSKFIFAAKLSLIIALGLSSAALAEVNLPIADSLDPNVTTQIKTTVNNNDTLQVIHNGAANQTFNNSWKSFDVPENKYVDFNFSNAGQVSVNKITGGNASQIYGHITQSGAGGTVYLINSSGVLFGRNSSVNLNSFAVSTYDLKPQDIQNKKFVFGGVNQNSIVNQGNINVSEGGFASFLAPVIENTGSINAPKGTIALVSGKDVTFNMNDGQQISLELDKSTVNNLVLDSNKSQIENAGLLKADGGKIFIKADKVNELINNVVNNTGVIEANTLTMKDGQIAFGKVDIDGGTGNTTIAGEINTKGKSGGFIDINSKNTYINGKLDAFGETGKGGTIKVLGDEVRLLGSSSIDASGDQGGGTVLIGGDNHGEGSIRTADYTFVGKDVNINANALTSGDGGKVIVWANDLTRYFGNISAKGGLLSGNGGFSEVSGKKYLNFYGDVDLSSYKGQYGTLLLDPTNITIVSGAIGADNGELADSQILASDRAGQDLTISEATLEGLAAAANIRLEATNDITLGPLADHLLNLKTTWPGSLTILADSDNNGVGTFSMDSADKIRTEGGNIDITGAILNISNLDTRGAAGNRSGSITLTGKSQVNTAASTTLNTGSGITISGSDAGSINLGSLSTLRTGDINISSGSGTINIASGVNFDATTSISTAGAGANVTLGALNLSRGLYVDTNSSSTTSDIILQGNITSAHEITLVSARDIIFNPGVELTTARDIYMNTHNDGAFVFNSDINNPNSISTGEDLYLYSDYNLASILDPSYSIDVMWNLDLYSVEAPIVIPTGTTLLNKAASAIYIGTGAEGASITLPDLNLSASLTVNTGGWDSTTSDIILQGDITSTNDITLSTAGKLIFNPGVDLTTTSDMYMNTYNDGAFVFNSDINNPNSISSRNLDLYSDYNLASILDPSYSINAIGYLTLTNAGTPIVIPEGTTFGTASSVNINTIAEGASITLPTLNLSANLNITTSRWDHTQRDIILQGNLSSTGDINLSTAGKLVFNPNTVISAGGDLTAYSYGFHGILVNPGGAGIDTFELKAGGILDLNNWLYAGNSIESVKFEGREIWGAVDTTGSVIYNDTEGDLAIDQISIDFYRNGDLFISSAGTISLSTNINTNRNITLAGNGFDLNGFKFNTTGNLVFNDTSGVLNINQAYIDSFGANDLTINSINAISLIENINTNKNITLQGTDILYGGFTLNSPGTISLYDTDGDLTINQAYVNAFGTGNLAVRSAGLLSLGGNINSTRNINLTGTDINSGGFNLNTSGNVVLNDTAGALSINQAYINTFGTSNLTINSAGLINLSGDINTNRNISVASNGFDTTNSYYFNHGTGSLTFNDSTFDINARVKGSGNINATGKNITFTGLDSALNINNITSNSGAVSIELKDGDTNSGNISIGTISADSVLIQNNKSASTSNITINNGGSITAAGAGNSLVLSTVKGNFINNSGAGALSANNGRWLVYSSSKPNTVLGGLVGTESTGKTYVLNSPASIIGAGNQIIFANGTVYTVTVTNFSKVYGSNNPIFTYGISNAADGDTITGTALLSCAATNASSVGLFTITASLGTLSSAQGNSFEFVDGTLTITQKDITIKADDKSKTYGAANPIFTSTFTGLVNGDVASDFGLTYNVAGNPVNAGTYNNSITPSALSGAKSSNYNVTAYQTGNFVINPKALSIVADNKSKTYGSPNPIFTGTVLGLVNGDTEAGIGVNYTSPAILTSNVGTYNIIPSITSTNYSPTYTNGTLTINPAIPVAPVTPPSDPVNPEVIKDVTAPVDNNTQKDLGQNNNTQAEDPVKPDENNDQEIKQGIDNPTLPINNSSEEETTGSSEKDTVNSNELTIKSYNYQDFDPDELKRSYELLLKAVNYSNEPDLEYQADKEAVLYLKEAGYSPKAINAYLMLVKVLEDLKSKENLNEIKKDPLGFERHPKTSSRIIKIQNLIKKENLEQYSKKNLQRKSYDNFVKNNQDVLELTPKIKEIINYIHLKNTQYIY